MAAASRRAWHFLRALLENDCKSESGKAWAVKSEEWIICAKERESGAKNAATNTMTRSSDNIHCNEFVTTPRFVAPKVNQTWHTVDSVDQIVGPEHSDANINMLLLKP